MAAWDGFEFGDWEEGFNQFSWPPCCGLPCRLKICGVLGGCEAAVIPVVVVDFSLGSRMLFAWGARGVCGPILGIHSIETSDHFG